MILKPREIKCPENLDNWMWMWQLTNAHRGFSHLYCTSIYRRGSSSRQNFYCDLTSFLFSLFLTNVVCIKNIHSIRLSLPCSLCQLKPCWSFYTVEELCNAQGWKSQVKAPHCIAEVCSMAQLNKSSVFELVPFCFFLK